MSALVTSSGHMQCWGWQAALLRGHDCKGLTQTASSVQSLSHRSKQLDVTAVMQAACSQGAPMGKI